MSLGNGHPFSISLLPKPPLTLDPYYLSIISSEYTRHLGYAHLFLFEGSHTYLMLLENAAHTS